MMPTGQPKGAIAIESPRGITNGFVLERLGGELR
jgi:hypothetical protein